MNDIFYPVAHRSDEEIAALKLRYATFDEKRIPDMVKEIGLTAVSWEKPASWSTSHVIYIVTARERPRPVVIRANIGWGEPEVYMLTEKLITDQVATMRVPVNRILYVDVTRTAYPFDYQIQDMLEGSDIEAHFHGTRTEYDQLSFDLGQYVALWGELTYEGFGRFDEHAATCGILKGTKTSMYNYILVRLDDDIRFLADAGIITTTRADAIRSVFETHHSVLSVGRGTLVQYDLADHNIMYAYGDSQNGRFPKSGGLHFGNRPYITGIFDWEAAVAGDPMLDLASAPTWKTHYPREKKLIEGYKSVRDLPNFWKEKIEVYRLRTMLWKMVHAIRTRMLNNDRRKKFNAALVPFKLGAP